LVTFEKLVLGKDALRGLNFDTNSDSDSAGRGTSSEQESDETGVRPNRVNTRKRLRTQGGENGGGSNRWPLRCALIGGGNRSGKQRRAVPLSISGSGERVVSNGFWTLRGRLALEGESTIHEEGTLGAESKTEMNREAGGVSTYEGGGKTNEKI